MKNEHKIVIKREELYERIWQTPARQLAKEYELSDARLTVICRQLKVPKPEPGYWTKKRFRQKRGRPNSPLLDRIRLVFLAFTDLDGFITFKLD